MKAAAAALLLVAVGPVASAEEVSPIGKVLELINAMQAKVIGEGEESQKIYEEFSEWCEEQNKNLNNEIKTAKADIKDLGAVIDEESAIIESLTTKTEELAGKVQVDEQDLKAATHIREKEAKVFEEEKNELDDIIDTLGRAIGILEKHEAASFLQGAQSLTQALASMVKAAVFGSADAQRLTALVQESQQDQDDDAGAPAAATYEEHSGGIVDTLKDLLDKAEVQLQNARNKETIAIHNFQALKQSIEDALAYAKKEMEEAKKGINESSEKKASAEGELAVTTKDLNEDNEALKVLHTDCMTKAEEFEAETKSRGEELEAIAKAKQIITETTGGADELSYGLAQESFVQLGSRSKLSSGMQLAHFEAVRFVRDLARRRRSPALAQLASRMAAAMRDGHSSKEDIFAKVKGLIAGMIEKLEAEGQADAKHKDYCDKELGHASEKKEDRVGEIEKLTTSLDQMNSKSAQLKEEVATLQKELSDITSSQAKMDKLRREEHENFAKEKAAMELGIDGVKRALKVLRDYYAKDAAHSSAQGAGGGIIGLLEVCESDFEKGLSEAVGEEQSAQDEYEKVTKENEIETTTKEQDVKYKTKEGKDLAKTVAEAASDQEAVQAELDAVQEYLTKLHEECDEKAEPYEETVKQRNAEIAGLKEALQVLEGEAALLQQSERSSREVKPHVAMA